MKTRSIVQTVAKLSIVLFTCGMADGCTLDDLNEFLDATTEALNGIADGLSDAGPVSGGVSGTTVSCGPGYHIYMPYGRDPVCQPNAQGSGSRSGTNHSTITGD